MYQSTKFKFSFDIDLSTVIKSLKLLSQLLVIAKCSYLTFLNFCNLSQFLDLITVWLAFDIFQIYFLSDFKNDYTHKKTASIKSQCSYSEESLF